VAVIVPYDGVPTLMFRTANKRQNQILEAQMQVGLVRDEITAEGQFMRRVHNLKLVRSQNPVFFLTWSVMHPIDEYSPLYGATPDSLATAETMFIVTLTGIDETVSQTIHTRHTYIAQDIMWDMRFVDIVKKTANGQRYIDYSRFHDVIPIGE
jgi:inward rectifier potassium channel